MKTPGQNLLSGVRVLVQGFLAQCFLKPLFAQLRNLSGGRVPRVGLIAQQHLFLHEARRHVYRSHMRVACLEFEVPALALAAYKCAACQVVVIGTEASTSGAPVTTYGCKSA